MSKITLEPNSSGAGTFSIVSPDSNTNRTLNLPDESGTVATTENIPPGYEDQDALDLFNATGSAPVFACRAWVNFDGNSPVSIRESGNVSSITDNGTGDYTINFTTAMPDENYCVSGTCRVDLSGSINVADLRAVAIRRLSDSLSTSSVHIQTVRADNGSKGDVDTAMVSVTR